MVNVLTEDQFSERSEEMNRWFSASLLLGKTDTYVMSDNGSEWPIELLVIVNTIINRQTSFYLFYYKCWVGGRKL